MKNEITKNGAEPIATPNAEEILLKFHDPLDFTISGMKSTLLSIYNDHASNLKNSVLNDRDFYNLYYMTQLLDEIEEYNNSLNSNQPKL